jgi:uncharacterized protein YabE (DUF348 family)
VKSANVELHPADRVSPALDASVENGSVINVNMAKAVKVSLDGAEKTVSTTAQDVGGLVTQLGVASSSELSVPKSAQLAVDGSFVAISTPKTVSIIADGKARKTTTTAANVGEVLKDAGIRLAAADRTSQPALAPVVNNMVIKVSRVTGKTATVTEEIQFQSLSTDSATLPKGEEKVTQEGVPGQTTLTYKLVLVDGREASRTLVSKTTTREPVTEKITVGTKEEPKPAAAEADSGNTGAAAPAMMNVAMWDKIAQCESGGNWSINSGNGYYGGLQFDVQTWIGAGGGAYAPNASQATKAQQIDIANRVYAERGLQPWGCGWAASS